MAREDKLAEPCKAYESVDPKERVQILGSLEKVDCSTLNSSMQLPPPPSSWVRKNDTTFSFFSLACAFILSNGMPQIWVHGSLLLSDMWFLSVFRKPCEALRRALDVFPHCMHKEFGFWCVCTVDFNPHLQHCKTVISMAWLSCGTFLLIN